jgi:hypothetical protein
MIVKAEKPIRKTLFARNAQPERDLQCARIIAADPVRYAGIQTVWANRILKFKETNTNGTTKAGN